MSANGCVSATPIAPSRAAPHYMTLANSRTTMQAIDDKFCRRGRLFSRNPVTAIQDERIFDVLRDTPHHRADHEAECSFATEGQDRHLKLALREERPAERLAVRVNQATSRTDFQLSHSSARVASAAANPCRLSLSAACPKTLFDAHPAHDDSEMLHPIIETPSSVAPCCLSTVM